MDQGIALIPTDHPHQEERKTPPHALPGLRTPEAGTVRIRICWRTAECVRLLPQQAA